MSPELSKQSEDVRSHVRHSKDMNPDSKFLTLKWVWCCDGKTYLESCLNFLDFIQIESLLLWCLSFNSWWCFFFFFVLFLFVFYLLHFFRGFFQETVFLCQLYEWLVLQNPLLSLLPISVSSISVCVHLFLCVCIYFHDSICNTDADVCQTCP